jgi:hypothetical protein
MRGAIVCVGLLLTSCGGTPFFERGGLGSIPNDDAAVAASNDAADDAFWRAIIVVEQDATPDASASPPDVVEATTPAVEAAAEAAPDVNTTLEACAPVTHFNGLGASWIDCAPLNTFTEAQAFAACRATYGTTCALVGYVCGHDAGPSPNCACWQIAGANAGWVFPGTWGAGGCAATVAAKMWD